MFMVFAISNRSFSIAGSRIWLRLMTAATPSSGLATASLKPLASAFRKPFTASGFASAKSVFTMMALP